MTITPILVGGLGNRLYQLANALRLQEKFNADLKLFKIKTQPNDVMNHRSLVLRLEDFDDFGGHTLLEKEGLPKTISELFPTLNIDDEPQFINDILSNKQLVYENNVHLVDGKNDIVVMGYFFGYNFVSSQIENMRKLFNPVLDEYIDKNYPLLSSKRVLGIHLRLGIGSDNNPAVGVPLDFYNQILQSEENNFDLIYVVTDNPEKAKNFIPNLDIKNIETIIIENEPMFVDMLILSKCTTLIIAPSTLSAWSAYLNKNNNIYVPKIWVRHHWTSNIPKEWKLL
jgi:hypothetical protein